MNREETRQSCPICKNKQFVPSLTCIDYYLTKEEFELCNCSECGMLITKNFPAESQIGKYYETENYISHSDTKAGITNKIYHIARRYMNKKKLTLVEKYSTKEHEKKKQLLDVGAGTGYFANEMQKNQWKAVAIEKNQKSKEFAQKNFNLLSYSSIKELPSAEKFDAITLWHVLEHIEDLDFHLKSFHKLLKKQGILILALPNPSSCDAGYYKQHWAAYDVPRHLWHFSPLHTEKLISQYKFKLVKTMPMYLDAFYISILSEQYRGTKNAFVKGIFRGLNCFFKTLKDKNEASSLIYIFQKK